MTPKEKAKELYLKYRNYTNDCSSVNKPHEPIKYVIELGMKDGRAKQCALIAVDEIIKCLDSLNQYTTMDYYIEVKQEIEKL